MTVIDGIRRAIAAVIMASWIGRITTKSDFARVEADAIAAAASEGYITTRIGQDEYSRLWLPTPVGLEYLSEVHPEVEF